METPKHLKAAERKQRGEQAVATKPKALELMASRLSIDPSKILDTLKGTVFRGASNEELVALVVVSNEYRLNPFLKEIYAFPAKGGGITPIVSIDGWIKMINRQENFDGIEFEFLDGDGGLSCTARIFVKGRSKPVAVTEYYEECYRETAVWKQMPRRMLRHKAMIQAGRVAFGFAGVYDEDEAVDIKTGSVEVESYRPTQAAADDGDLGPVPSSEGAVPQIEAPKNFNKAETKTVYEQFDAFLAEIGVTFQAFNDWGVQTGNIEGSVGCLNEVPAKTLQRLLNAKSGLTTALKGN